MPCPVTEPKVDAGLEAVRSVPVYQVEAEFGEAVARLVVAEVRPEHGT